jgi:hypothetical protein
MFDGFSKRASRRGQFHGETHAALINSQVFDHSETHDIAMQLGILDVAERVYDPFFGEFIHV